MGKDYDKTIKLGDYVIIRKDTRARSCSEWDAFDNPPPPLHKALIVSLCLLSCSLLRVYIKGSSGKCTVVKKSDCTLIRKDTLFKNKLSKLLKEA